MEVIKRNSIGLGVGGVLAVGYIVVKMAYRSICGWNGNGNEEKASE
jgi:hypothetical protein